MKRGGARVAAGTDPDLCHSAAPRTWPLAPVPARLRRGAPADEPPVEAVVAAAVIAVPDGATSHHFAPKLSLPWPLVLPALVSATK